MNNRLLKVEHSVFFQKLLQLYQQVVTLLVLQVVLLQMA